MYQYILFIFLSIEMNQLSYVSKYYYLEKEFIIIKIDEN
jgi:hypothetical protein